MAGSNTSNTGSGMGIIVPDSICSVVMTKLNNAKARPILDSLRVQMRAGTIDSTTIRTKSSAIYKGAGVDPDTARACTRNAGGSAGSGSAGAAIGPPVVAFVKTPTGWSPRMVRLGVSDFDNTEVISGLKEGDEVAPQTPRLLPYPSEHGSVLIRPVNSPTRTSRRPPRDR